MFFSYPEEWNQRESTHGYGPIRLIWGERAMVAIITVPANQPLEPFHKHPNEQMGVVLEGETTLTIGDETRTLKPGDAYIAPPNVPHGRAAVSKRQIKMLEVFSPPREDLVKQASRAK
jgi:quercetin dioxygenase-like cupin family protein